MPRRKESLQLAGALGWGRADKRLEILRRVGEAGSISQAARDAGVSYKAAWQAIDTLGNLAGAPLVEKAVGGAGGGGARLTAAGEQVLSAAGAFAHARQEVLARIANDAPGALGALQLRTSMRNQLPAQVQAVRRRAGAVDVVLALAGGLPLVARITLESAQLLGLAPGQRVLALCKATAVRMEVAHQANDDAGAQNLLAGTVRRASRAREGGEVALELDGGARLVGFGAAGLRVGQRAWARVDPVAVVVALPG